MVPYVLFIIFVCNAIKILNIHDDKVLSVIHATMYIRFQATLVVYYHLIQFYVDISVAPVLIWNIIIQYTILHITFLFSLSCRPNFMHEVYVFRRRAWYVGLDGSQILEADRGSKDILEPYPPLHSPFNLSSDVRFPPWARTRAE